MGAMLVGPPGTGKTSFVRALAIQYRLSVKSFQLSTFTDSEFCNRLKECASTYPQILLFEDIDVFFKERVSKTSNISQVPLTFSTFLNAIDGIKDTTGFWVATANDVTPLDSALLRPFRFGAPIMFGNLAEEGRKVIAEQLLNEWPDLMAEAIGLPGEYTGAEFKNLCIDMALEHKWEGDMREVKKKNFSDITVKLPEKISRAKRLSGCV